MQSPSSTAPSVISDVEKSTTAFDESVSPTSRRHTDSIDNKDAERKLVRKLDLRIMPCLALAYLVTSLDVSFWQILARVAGMTQDVGLVGNDFLYGVMLFYILYVICDVPATLFVRKFGFQWIPYSIILFGFITIGNAFIQTRVQFIVIRGLLGAAESAVLPGNAYILARYYRREELTVRIAFFLYSAAYTASAVGGLLASGFISLGSVGVVHTWRHIFLWEGVLTIVIGVFLCWAYPKDPTEASGWFNEQEQQLVLARLQAGALDGKDNDRKAKLSFREVVRIITQPAIVVSAFLFICNNIVMQGLISFMPTIIRTNYPGISNVKVQLMTVPPNVTAWVVGMTCAFFAMRTRQHAFVAIFAACLCLTGYLIWFITDPADPSQAKARYAGVFLTNSGSFYGPLVMAWAVSNVKSDKARALTSAAVSGFGAIGSVISPWTYMPSTASSGYRPGNIVNISLQCVVICTVIALRVQKMIYNKRSGPNGFKHVY
ncbi:hypothetical protein OIO90_006462 [Microbotryomycetes sp. JL221]|nr:hypothetical protein OIO90_006462 [Microbotryomycetes sp. JL221]